MIFKLKHRPRKNTTRVVKRFAFLPTFVVDVWTDSSAWIWLSYYESHECFHLGNWADRTDEWKVTYCSLIKK